MSKLRLLSMAAVLALALAAPVFAGITDTPPAPPPPGNPTGIYDTPPNAQPADPPSDPVLNLALTLLQSVLSVF